LFSWRARLTPWPRATIQSRNSQFAHTRSSGLTYFSSFMAVLIYSSWLLSSDSTRPVASAAMSSSTTKGTNFSYW